MKKLYILEVEGRPSLLYPWRWETRRGAVKGLKEVQERHPGIAYRLATYVRQKPKPR